MGRIHEDHATSLVNPGVSQHESGSSQSAQPGDWVRMDATPGGSPGSSSPVAGDHRPLCDLANSKAPSVLCSSVGTQGSRGRCIPPAFGRLQAYACPPIAIITRVLLKLRASHPDRPLLASKRMVSSSTGPPIRHFNRTTLTSRSVETTAFPSVSRQSPFVSSDCVAPLKRFARQADFFETVAGHLALCRRNSRLNCQARGGKVPKMVQSLPSSVLRALNYNFEDRGIFDLFIHDREGCCVYY